MSEPRLLYFNIRAKGELLRFIAHAGGVKFQDERIPMADWQEKYKSKTPFGQLPCLIVNNEWHAQKLSLAFYLAKKGGLYPTSGNEVEAMKYDSVLLYTDEILENLLEGFRHKKFNNNPETLEKVKTETLPKKLPVLENILKSNGTGYLVGSKLSIADLGAFDILEHIVDIGGLSYLDPYPQLKALYQRVGQLDSIKNYIASRPTPQEGFDF